MRSKLAGYIKLAIIVIYLATLVGCSPARADGHDEPKIGIFRGDDPTTEVLVVSWDNGDTFRLRVKGRVADKKNEEAVMQWMADRTDEHLEKVYGK